MNEHDTTLGITIGDRRNLFSKLTAEDSKLTLAIFEPGAYFRLDVLLQRRYNMEAWTHIATIAELIENLELFAEGLKAHLKTLEEE